MASDSEYVSGKQKSNGHRRWAKHSCLFVLLLIICFFWLGVYVATVYLSHHFTEECKSVESGTSHSSINEGPSVKSTDDVARDKLQLVHEEPSVLIQEKEPESENQIEKREQTGTEDQNGKLIVLHGAQTWGKYDIWDASDWSKCPKSKCRITTNTNLIDKSSAVVFNAVKMPHDAVLKDLLEKKSRSQHNTKFVFMSGLTPTETFFKPEAYDGFFDLTMTYKSNSDIRIPFWPNNGILPAMLRPKNPEKKLTDEEKSSLKERNKNYFVQEGKDGFMLIVLNNCDPQLYANIFNMRLRWEGDITVMSRQECNATAMRFPSIEKYPCEDMFSDSCSKFMEGYKFVVLPEKHICVDHLDRAYWYSLRAWEAVPILWGSDDVEEQTIPGSYINTLHHLYISPVFKEAILSKSDSRQYSVYMNWKYEHRLEEFYWQCELCDKLNSGNSEDVKTKKMKFSEFWDKEANCGENTKLFKSCRDQLKRTAAIP